MAIKLEIYVNTQRPYHNCLAMPELEIQRLASGRHDLCDNQTMTMKQCETRQTFGSQTAQDYTNITYLRFCGTTTEENIINAEATKLISHTYPLSKNPYSTNNQISRFCEDDSSPSHPTISHLSRPHSHPFHPLTP